MRYLAGILFFVCFGAAAQTVKMEPPVAAIIISPIEDNKSVKVTVQDQTTPAVNLYLYQIEATVLITGTDTIDSRTITVNSITGVDAGDVITIYEGNRIFQSIVLSAASNIITFASPLDYAFTPAAIVEVGRWNFNIDASSVIKTAYIKTPPIGNIDIYSVIVSITDNVDMDMSKFGGITALTNGIVFRKIDGSNYNRALIINNAGFVEQGFDIEFHTKAAAGQYGMTAVKNLNEKNGVVIRLEPGMQYVILLQDNLTGLINFNCTIQGHFTTE